MPYFVAGIMTVSVLVGLEFIGVGQNYAELKQDKEIADSISHITTLKRMDGDISSLSSHDNLVLDSTFSKKEAYLVQKLDNAIEKFYDQNGSSLGTEVNCNTLELASSGVINLNSSNRDVITKEECEYLASKSADYLANESGDNTKYSSLNTKRISRVSNLLEHESTLIVKKDSNSVSLIQVKRLEDKEVLFLVDLIESSIEANNVEYASLLIDKLALQEPKKAERYMEDLVANIATAYSSTQQTLVNGSHVATMGSPSADVKKEVANVFYRTVQEIILNSDHTGVSTPIVISQTVIDFINDNSDIGTTI